MVLVSTLNNAYILYGVYVYVCKFADVKVMIYLYFSHMEFLCRIEIFLLDYTMLSAV